VHLVALWDKNFDKFPTRHKDHKEIIMKYKWMITLNQEVEVRLIQFQYVSDTDLD